MFVFFFIGEGVEFFKILIYWVYINLKCFNKYKVFGLDGIFNWVLKEYVEILV